MISDEDRVEDRKRTSLGLILMIIAMAIIICMISVTGCTLSFQNVMTSGTASDVVDSDPTTDTTADPNINIPIPSL